ncbi:MAG: DUF1573 domain-containing protein [Candidatus Magasanikbacteria bacterium]|nr:DUF1573 domain-containing protein [Candidatus Magasanikbacteria bacterium]
MSTDKKRNNYPWLIGGLALLAVIGLIVYFAVNDGGQNSPAAASASKNSNQLASEEDNFDFGTVPMGNGKVSHSFKLKNDGESALLINKVYTSCMCTNANVISASGTSGPFGMPGHGGAISKANVTINPGEEFSVEAVFDPAAHGPAGVGLAQRSIFLETNSTISPKVELRFRANVVNN